jgi:hypothetical protein
MASWMIARGRRVSTAILLWTAAVLLAVADGLAASSVRVSSDGLRIAALVVAGGAGFLIGTTLLRGLGSVVAYVRIRRAMRAHRLLALANVHQEAMRGIAQIEAFLAEQQSHGT